MLLALMVEVEVQVQVASMKLLRVLEERNTDEIQELKLHHTTLAIASSEHCIQLESPFVRQGMRKAR